MAVVVVVVPSGERSWWWPMIMIRLPKGRQRKFEQSSNYAGKRCNMSSSSLWLTEVPYRPPLPIMGQGRAEESQVSASSVRHCWENIGDSEPSCHYHCHCCCGCRPESFLIRVVSAWETEKVRCRSGDGTTRRKERRRAHLESSVLWSWWWRWTASPASQQVATFRQLPPHTAHLCSSVQWARKNCCTLPLALFHSKHEEFIGAFVHSGQQKKYRRLMWTGHKANTAQAAAA